MPTDALITQSIPSLINGVSQQPTVQRLTSQCEAQDNVVSDAADGAVVRPPAEHIDRILSTLTPPAGGFKVEIIDRGDGQQFLVLLQNGDVNVYDLTDGSEVVVNDNAAGAEGAYTYLGFNTSDDDAETAFAVVTVEDYTFISNRQTAPQLSGVTDLNRENAHEFLFWAGQPGPESTSHWYNEGQIIFDGTSVGVTGLVDDSSTSIMNAACSALTGTATPNDTVGTASGTTNWRFTRMSNTLLYAYQFQGTNESIEVTDNWGNSVYNLLVTNASDGEAPVVAAYSDLPAIGRDDFVVKVSGDEGSRDDDFYVKYVEDERGVWRETVKPGLDNTIDDNSMPHALVYNVSTNEFTFEPNSWDDRLVGDTNSAPVPSFVTRPVRDIKLHKNRLVFIAGENAIASEAGSFFNFWPTTVTTLVDSDPFDVSGASDGASVWDYAVPYRGNLTLFSTIGEVIGELVGSRDEQLTIQNARIETRANYVHSDVRPRAAGELIYFLNSQGGGSAVSAYVQADVDVWRADEVTAHVPRYLPPTIDRMAVGRAENMLVAFDSDDQSKVYIYRWHFIGSEQAMSSWSRWCFEDGDSVVGGGWINSVLYLVVQRGDGVHLEKYDFGRLDEDFGRGTSDTVGHRIHLDSLLYLTGTYDVVADETTWTIPYDQATIGGTYRIVKGGAWGDERDSVVSVKDASVNGTITATGDFSANPVFIGREYVWTYELSQIHLRDTQARRSTGRGRLVGRLQLRRGRVVYEQTGTFKVEIRSREDSDVYTNEFTSQFVNQAVIGPTVLDDGVFEFDIGGSSEHVRVIFTGSSFLPARLTSFEWDARYYSPTNQA